MTNAGHLPTARAEAQRQHRKQNWKIDDLQQEASWREWFPKACGEMDWSQDLTDAETLVAYAACTSFINQNVIIKFPGKGKIPFILRDAQKDVLYNWIKKRRTVALKARQVGFSTLAGAYSLWLTFGWGDRLIVMLSKGEREAVSLLRKAKDAFRFLPDWVKFRGPKVTDKTSQRLTFDNDSQIQSLPSASDPARGESVFIVFVDEWAFLPNPEEAWASIEPVTDLGGRVVGISTANGEGNFFHNLWLGSQSGLNTFTGIFHSWRAVDDRDDEWYAQKKRDLQPWQIAQEYPTTPEEAFVGSGNPVFNLDVLRALQDGTHDPLEVVDIFVPATGPKKYELVSGGNFSIYELPDDKAHYSYVVGADVAEGLEHGDYTVAQVICVQTNHLVAVWHGHVDPDIFGEKILPAIGWFYRYAVVAPEVNNHGLTVLKALQRVKYGRIYRRRSFAKRQDIALETMGWLTTATSKPLLVDELQAWLRDTPALPDTKTIAELRAFSRDPNGKMSGRPHDDRVMSLGIAVQARKYAIIEHIMPDVAPDQIKGSFAWYEKKLDKLAGRVERKHRVNGKRQ